MSKFRKLSALNKDALKEIKGQGEGDLNASCNKSGDTIICAMGTDVKLCDHFEASCTGGRFSSKCNIVTGITVTCPVVFNVKPKE